MAYIPIDIFKVSKDLNTLNSSFLSPTQGLSSLDHDMLLLTSDPSSNSVDSFNMYFKQGIKSIVNIGSSYVVDASKSSNAISYKIAPEITFTDWTALKADKAKVVVNGNWRNLLNDYGEKDILVRDLNENDFSDVDWTNLLSSADVSITYGSTTTRVPILDILESQQTTKDKVDGLIVQETGANTDKTISQKAETTLFSNSDSNVGISKFSELKLGENYSAGDVVRYNGLLYYFTDDVNSLNLSSTISGWPLKTYNGNTYKCTKNILQYSSSTTYANKQMALKDGLIKIYDSGSSTWTPATLDQVAAYEGGPIDQTKIADTYMFKTSIFALHKNDVVKVIHLISPKTYISAYINNNTGGSITQTIGLQINVFIYSTEYIKSFKLSGTSQAGEAGYDIAFYNSDTPSAESFISGKYYYSGGPTEFSETFTIPANAVCFGVTDVQWGNIKISDMKLKINAADLSDTFKDELSVGSYKLKYGNSINSPFNFTSGKKVTFFGDSIPAGVASTGPDTRTDLTTTHYPYLFAKKYGMTLDNQCDSGDRILGNTQYSIIPNITGYTASTDFIFVHAGINDYGGASPLGVLGDTANTTVYGSLYIICEYFKAHYSSTPITFITPINHWRVLTGAVSPLNAYRNAIFEMATKYGFNVVDGSKIGFPDVYDDTAFKSIIMADGLHPTELGHSMLFKSLCGILGDNSNLIVQTSGTATDMVMSQNAVSTYVASSKDLLFRDMWLYATNGLGSYNAQTSYYSYNGLIDITYAQAIVIYNHWIKNITSYGYINVGIRANLPFHNIGIITSQNIEGLFMDSQNMEVAYLNDTNAEISVSGIKYAFYNCSSLVSVTGIISLSSVSSDDLNSAFIYCYALKNIKIKNLQTNFNIKYCKVISYDSMAYLIGNATNSSMITVTVNSDIYSKLMDTTGAYPQWNALALTASGKNIAFANSAVNVYLSGAFNSWSTSDDWKFIESSTVDVYTLDKSFDLSGEFKVSTADWSTVNYGSNGNAVVINVTYTMTSGSNTNMQFSNSSTVYSVTKVTFNKTAGTLLITGTIKS